MSPNAAAPSDRDYYAILGVAPGADEKTIRSAFRDLALKYHPDRNKDAGAEARFREIVEAYAVLADPQKRSQYDAQRAGKVAPGDLLGGVDLDAIFRDLGGELWGDTGRGAESVFERFFGARRRAGPRRGDDLEVHIEVPLELVLAGGEQVVKVARRATCDACKGTGANAGTALRACSACSGTGSVSVTRGEGAVVVRQVSTCSACGGRGKSVDVPCGECHGRGSLEREEAFTVKVPAGVEDGMRLRIPGHGMESSDSGGATGDLLVRVSTMTDNRFARHGADLVREQTIDIVDAVLGATIEVPTLAGPVRTKVPKGTQPGTVLRLRHKGLPRLGGGRRGDLLVELHLTIPQHLSSKEAELYTKLRALRSPTIG